MTCEGRQSPDLHSLAAPRPRSPPSRGIRCVTSDQFWTRITCIAIQNSEKVRSESSKGERIFPTEIPTGQQCSDAISRKALQYQMAGGLGFEPRLTESESAVLPLNYPPIRLVCVLRPKKSDPRRRRMRKVGGTIASGRIAKAAGGAGRATSTASEAACKPGGAASNGGILPSAAASKDIGRRDWNQGAASRLIQAKWAVGHAPPVYGMDITP